MTVAKIGVLGAEPAEHALEQRDRAAVGIHARDLRADLQAVARAFHALDVGQLADRRVEEVERPARLHRDLDLPPLPVRQRRGAGRPVDESDAAHVRHRGRDDEDHQEQPQEEDAALAAVINADQNLSAKTSTNIHANTRRT